MLQDIAESGRRAKRKQSSLSTNNGELVLDTDNDVEDEDISKKDKDAAETLSGMTEEEITQHLKLCMKLSVENKINTKNAFGLHLIGIMQKIVNKNEKADIQQASLSLQASSKIYAGRVEALYQDTIKFHGQLQSIVSGGKKGKKVKDAEEEEGDIEEDGSENRKSKPQKSKCKSFLKSEESLSIEQDGSSLSTGEPHGNFVTTNSCFSTSRLAPKLLSSLQLVNDSCMLRCAVPEPSFKAISSLDNTYFTIPPKLKGILEKIKNFNASQSGFQALLTPTEVPYAPHMSTPKPVAPSPLFDGDNSVFAIPFDVSMAPGSADDASSVESAIEKFDVLNITANVFVNDIAAAVTDQGIDHTLLPPNSALKKMLDRSRRTSVKPSTIKTTKQKTKEPFFTGKSANDVKHVFVKGRATSLSQKTLSEWNIENTSSIDSAYEFIKELESRKEHDLEYYVTLDEVLDVIKQNDLQHHFKYYFHKQSQMWKISRRKLCLNESQHSAAFGNQTEKRVGSTVPNDPEDLAVSLQNLSIHDSIHEIPDSANNDFFNETPDFADAEDQHCITSPELFESDIENLMVKPPDLVKPACMKYEKKPANLNIEKIKDLMMSIIFRHLEERNSTENEKKQFVLFSVVYEELKIKLERDISEFISAQFAFVVLLLLANQKTLLIEDTKENSDLSIKLDISEIDNV